MRRRVVFNLMKDDWYNRRWMILCYFVIPLLFDVALICGRGILFNYLQHQGVNDINGVLNVISTVFVFVFYALIFVSITSRLSGEASSGFYSFLRVIPVTVEEVVTAKFVSTFILNTCVTAWLFVLWWGYDQSFPYSTEFKVWTGFYLITFLFPLFMGLHHSLFFRFRGEGSGFLYVTWFLALLYFDRSHWAVQVADRSTQLLKEYPLVLIGSGIVVLFCVWIACWRWGMTNYRRHLDGELQSSKG